MSVMASQITSLTIVYSSVYSGTDQRKHQSSASPAFVRGIHRWPVNSPHKWPVTEKMFSFDDVIMNIFKPGQNAGDVSNAFPWTWSNHHYYYFNFHSEFTEVCSGQSISQKVNTSPCNGLVSNRRQAITITMTTHFTYTNRSTRLNINQG